jgi:hypothetical protein
LYLLWIKIDPEQGPLEVHEKFQMHQEKAFQLPAQDLREYDGSNKKPEI